MIRLFRYFQEVSYMATAIKHWKETDPFLDQLVSLGDAIHGEFSSAPGIAGRALESSTGSGAPDLHVHTFSLKNFRYSAAFVRDH
jgi:hypothetical protein